MALTSSTQKELYQFFAIAFDAAPGVTYMSQLADAVNAGMTVKQVVNVFTSKTQFTETYPNFFTTNQFATKLVNNVVGDAASAEAKASAVADIEAALNAGWSRGDVIYQVFTNLANKPTTDATWGNTSKQMANQVAYAQYYTETLLTDTTDLTKLRAVISSVTQDTSIEPADILAVLVPPVVVPTYALAASAGSVNEGSAMNFTLTTTNVAAGTLFSYVISGVAATDLASGSLTGTATVDSLGVAVIPVSLVADATTEGAETLTLSVGSQTASVTVNDTSTTPVAVVPTYALTAGATSVNEGSSTTFTLTTTNVAAGTLFSYVISGVAATDLASGSLTGTATVDSLGVAVIPVSLVADATTEGAETLTLSVASQTASVTVNDTSTTPVVAVATYALAASAASVNEGAGMYFTLTTTNVAAGTTFSYVISGVSSSDVVGGSLTGTATIDSLGSAVISVNLLADAATEGSETITLSVATQTAGTTVNDTSTAVVATATTTLGAGIDTVTTADAGINIIDGSTTANSLTSSDSITDGSGTDNDKLVARYTSNQTSIRPTLTDVETIVVQSDAANVTMDLTRATGYDNLKVEAQNFTAGNDVLFSNVANGSTTLTVSAMTHINDTVAVQYKDAALADTNSLSLTLDTVTAGNISLTDAGGTTNTLETIAITTSIGSSNFHLIDAGVNFSAITLTGDQNLTLALSGAGNLASISGADFAGAFKTDLTTSGRSGAVTVVTGSGADSIVGGAGNDTITTGEGADTITNVGAGFDTVSSGAGADKITVASTDNVAIYGGADNDTITMAGNLTTGDTVDGGDGTDTLSLTGTITAGVYGTAVSNVEIVKMDLANITMTLNSADAASASGDTIDMSYAGNQSLSLSSGTSSFTGNVNVKLTGHLASDNDSVSAANSLGTINVIGNVGDITQYTSITGGNGSDTLTLTADSNSASANFTSVTKVETVTILANGQCDASITLTNATTALTIDATALTNTSADLTVIGGSYAGNLTISGGSGADQITAGTVNDAIYGGAGNDTITFASGTFNSNDTVSGGDGFDTIALGDTTIAAGSTASVNSNIEAIKLTAANSTMTMNSADTSGLTVDMTSTGNQTLTVSSGTSSFAGNVTVKMTGHASSDNESVSAANSLGTITVVGAVADITQYTSITGGNGSDVLTLTADCSATGANLLAVSKVETITITASGACDAVLTLGTDNTALTIDATALTNTSAELTVTGTTYAGNLTITGGAGNDTIVGGLGNDVINGGTGVDVITVGCGADTVSAGAGADTITVNNTGNVALYGEDGNDTFAFGGCLSSGDVVDGGAGAGDTVTITGAVTAGGARGLTNVEVINLSAAGASLTINSADVTAFSAGVTVDLTTAGNQTLSLASGASSFTGAVTVKMTGHASSDNESVSAANSLGTITVVGAVADITQYTSITGGNGSDVLTLTADCSATGANLLAVSKVETITITASGACDAVLTLGTDNTALTIDATALTNTSAELTVTGTTYAGNLTITGGAGNDTIVGGLGNDVINGGTGVDVITVGCGADTVSAGAGADTITVNNTGNVALYGEDGNDTFAFGGCLSSGDVVDGGAGAGDTVTITGAVTAGGARGLTNVEVINLSAAGASLTINSADVTAFSAGVTVDLTTAGNQTLSLASGASSFTGAVTVKMTGHASSDNESVSAANSLGTITVVGAVADITQYTSITGGNGSDVLTLTADCSATGANLLAVSKVETITITASGACDAVLTLGTDNTALTIDATALTNTSAELTVTGTTYAGNLTITGGNGSDTITGGTGTDLIIGGAGIDTLSGCGSDTLSGGTGDDLITISGAGATKVYGGDGNDTITTTSYLSGTDVIDGGDGVDTLIIGGAVTAGSLATVTNVEVISFSVAGDSLTLNSADLVAFTSNSFTVDMSVSGNQSINFGSGSKAFSGAVYVNMTNSGTGNESVIANSSTGTISVIGNMADLNTSDTLTAGGSSSDVITLTADDNSDGAVLTNVTGFTSITITGVGACDAKLTLGADTEALSITATSMTNSAANLNLLGNVYNGRLTISSGAGADSITGGNGADLIVTGCGADQITTGCGADTVSSGAGADTITISGTGMAEIAAGDDDDTITAAGYLSSDDIITGGAGFDIIAISANTASSSFYQSSGFEKVTLSGANTSLTLASNDSAAFVLISGSVTIDMDAAQNQSLVLGSGTLGFTGNVIVEIGSPGASLNDSVLAGGSLATFTVNGSVADIGSGVTITGGNGTDTLTLLVDNGAATLTSVTKVEQITLTGVGACDATLTLGTDSTAMTITATSMSNTSSDLWVKGATYTGALTISSGAGVDSITGGTGADYINGGAGHDVIVGGAGADTIFGGAGNDTITGNAGGDMLYGGAGCDTFYFSSNGVVNLDTIEDFVSGTGNDQIQIGNAAGFAWGNEAAGFHYSSDGLSNNYALIVLNESSSFDSAASASALADQLFVNNGTNDADGGAYIFIWQDSSSVVHISYGESVTGADSYKDVVKLVGVSLSTLLTNLGTGNIDLTS